MTTPRMTETGAPDRDAMSPAQASLEDGRPPDPRSGDPFPLEDEAEAALARVNAEADRTPRWSGLSGKLLVLTVLFVMLSEVLIFVPSMANFRNTWLLDKLTIAGVAASILVETDMVSPGVQVELLRTTGAVAIALDDGERRRLIAMSSRPEDPAGITMRVDMGASDPMTSIVESFRTLLFGSEGLMRIVGPTQMGLGGRVDIVMPQYLLHDAMLAFSVRILALSLVISAITATLVYLSLRWLFVRPIRQLTRAMARFQAAPEDPSAIIVPSGRNDEVGDAERRLEDMQRTMVETLEQRRRLANLGLAVSKINHDLRNLLASAQLFSERLELVADPTVQRLAPKIVARLDQAVGYTRSVLAYGSAREAPVQRRLVHLDVIVRDVGEVLGLSAEGEIAFDSRVAEGAEIDADPEQLFRVLMNLCRNSVQAMQAGRGEMAVHGDAAVRRLTVEAECRRDGATIFIRDTGPGIPPALRGRLFKPFQSVAKSGGTGLGLAIAAELVAAHGGTIRHLEEGGPGATFEITIPARPRATTGPDSMDPDLAGGRSTADLF